MNYSETEIARPYDRARASVPETYGKNCFLHTSVKDMRRIICSPFASHPICFRGPALFLDITIARNLIGVGQPGLIGVQQPAPILPRIEGAMENFATVIEIKSARVQGQLIFQVSLENRINLSVSADRLPADV